MTDEAKLILVDQIEPLIHEIRGQKVVLDSDLALLYGVPTKVLNQAIQRNIDRFPPDFRFQLTDSERDSLRSQIVTSNAGRGGRRYRPYVFTEQGVVMAASVLNSSPQSANSWCLPTRRKREKLAFTRSATRPGRRRSHPNRPPR